MIFTFCKQQLFLIIRLFFLCLYLSQCSANDLLLIIVALFDIEHDYTEKFPSFYGPTYSGSFDYCEAESKTFSGSTPDLREIADASVTKEEVGIIHVESVRVEQPLFVVDDSVVPPLCPVSSCTEPETVAVEQPKNDVKTKKKSRKQRMKKQRSSLSIKIQDGLAFRDQSTSPETDTSNETHALIGENIKIWKTPFDDGVTVSLQTFPYQEKKPSLKFSEFSYFSNRMSAVLGKSPNCH
jgi:hypothetical protein